MCVGGAVLVSRPGELDLVVLGDGEGPSLGCTVGAKIGGEIRCSRLVCRHKTQLFYDGRGSSCYRGREIAWGRCSSLGVLRGMGLGRGWQGVGVFGSEIVIDGRWVCGLWRVGVHRRGVWSYSFSRCGGGLVGLPVRCGLICQIHFSRGRSWGFGML